MWFPDAYWFRGSEKYPINSPEMVLPDSAQQLRSVLSKPAQLCAVLSPEYVFYAASVDQARRVPDPRSGASIHQTRPPTSICVPAPTIPLLPGLVFCGSCTSMVSHMWDLSQLGQPDIPQPLGDWFSPFLGLRRTSRVSSTNDTLFRLFRPGRFPPAAYGLVMHYLHTPSPSR